METNRTGQVITANTVRLASVCEVVPTLEIMLNGMSRSIRLKSDDTYTKRKKKVSFVNTLNAKNTIIRCFPDTYSTQNPSQGCRVIK